jgi:hypothetical protein
MKARICPVIYPPNEFMLPWVPMDVVYAPLEVFLVADCVLSKTWLPNPTSSLLLLSRRDVRFGAAAGKPMPGKQLLDSPPSCRIIGITLWQSPNCVQVIRQQADREQAKRKLLFRFGDGVAKTRPAEIRRQDGTAIVGDECKVERSTWHVVATIV